MHRRCHPELGERYLLRRRRAGLLFTENETNTERFFGCRIATPYVKDGINDYVVHGQRERGESENSAAPRRPPLRV